MWHNFHLTDNSRQPASTDEGYNKLYKLRPIINVTTEEFKQVYNIGQSVCVDERMIKGKEKKTFKAIYFDTTNQNGHQNLGNGSFMLWIFARLQVYRGRSGGNSD